MLHRAGFQPAADVRRHWAVYLGLVVALGIWCAVDVARRARVNPARPSLHMTDFTVYTEAGAAFFDGREPYDVTNIRGWKYLYPPLFALIVAPLAPLPAHWQATVWFGLSSLMALGCYFECRRLVGALCHSDVRSIKESESEDRFSVQSNRVSPGNPGAEKWGRPIPETESHCGASMFREGQIPLATACQGPIPVWLFTTALLAALFPALNCLQRGQMGIALVYPLLLGFRLICFGRTGVARFLGGSILALPIALKLTPALPAGCILATLFVSDLSRRMAGRGRPAGQPGVPRSTPGIPDFTFGPAAGLFAGALVCFLLFPAALIGWNENLHHLETWYVKVASRVNDVRDDDFGGDVASIRNQSLHNAVYRCGNWVAHVFFGGPSDLKIDVTKTAMPMDAPVVSHLLSATRIAALAAIGLVVVAAGRSPHLLLRGAAFGLAGVATLVVSPVSRGHYFVFWLPAVVFVPLWLHHLGRPRKALALAVCPAVLTLLHYVFLTYSGRVGLLGLGTTVWYALACQAVWSTRRANAVVAAPAQESDDARPPRLAPAA